MELTTDTIAAISTPQGVGGIGIVRLSGGRAVEIVRALFRTADNRTPRRFESHRLRHGFIVDPASGARVDEVMVAAMLAPRSYTREDVIEINCHGGPLPQQAILRLALAAGARMAQPGEFTMRAFLNGRLDLAQAESVAELIAAKSDAALRSAVSVLDGALSREIGGIREVLLGVLAILEASVDFPEEDLELAEQPELLRQADEAERRLAALIEQFERGRLLRDGLRTAIVGRPNVGKSSLLNALLLSDRAIVHPAPGTTRDVIEEWLNVEGVPLKLLDTAGIRASADAVEQLGIERSRAAIKEAELVLLVLDASAAVTFEDHELAAQVEDRAVILVLNKFDLPPRLTDEEAQALRPDAPRVRISALQRYGLDELRAAILRHASAGDAAAFESILVTRERHRAALLAARESLRRARESLRAALSGEFAAADLQAALEHLGEITGETCRDDVLDKIFAEFCIGK